MARKLWVLTVTLAAIPSLCSVSAAQPNSTTVDYLVISPDYECTRISPGGLDQHSARFDAFGWSAGPNGVPQNQTGDDMSLGSVPVEWAMPDTIFDAVSGQYALTESPNGLYGNNWNVTAQIDQSFNLAGAGTVVLQFWHHYELENNFDYGYVEVSTGASWSAVRTYNGTLGAPGTFTFVSVDLSSYLGQTIDIRFRVDTDGSVIRDGWVIDDVAVLVDGGGVFSDDLESGLGNWTINSQWGLTVPGAVNSLGTITQDGTFKAGELTGTTFVRAIYDGTIEATAVVDVYPPDWVP